MKRQYYVLKNKDKQYYLSQWCGDSDEYIGPSFIGSVTNHIELATQFERMTQIPGSCYTDNWTIVEVTEEITVKRKQKAIKKL